MKKLLHITLKLLIVTILLTACKDDENTKKDQKPSLVGTWSVTQFNVDLSVGGISLADYLVDSLEFSSQEVTVAEALIRSEINDIFENETITFKENSTYEVLIDNNLETGNWELNSEQTVLLISPMTDQTIQLAVNSLSEEVLKIGLNEEVAVEDYFDTSTFGLSFTNTLKIEGTFTLIKQD